MGQIFNPPRRYLIHRVFNKYADEPMGLNSLTYSHAFAVFRNFIDLDQFPATHFRLCGRAGVNEGGESVTLQMNSNASDPTLALAHTGGDDVVIGAANEFDSGWRTRDDGLTGFVMYLIAGKGTTATVDLNFRYFEIHWKY